MSKNGILILNSGSTSLKFAIYALTNNELSIVASGQFTGMPSATKLKIKDANGNELLNSDLTHETVDHEIALTKLIQLSEKFAPDFTITHAGHRIVLGGEKHFTAAKLDAETLDYLDGLSKIEPTHQSYEVMGARALAKVFPHIAQSATFDTSFHRTMPHVSEFYPVPDEITVKGVRHWGFHGISYAYINTQIAKVMPEAKRTIVAHLGGGASLCAIKEGKSIDTSMQFGAITGLPMATRSGDFPADAVFYLLKQGFYSVEQLESLLQKHSGLIGASEGLSEDMYVLENNSSLPSSQALEYFDYSVLKFIGAYTALLEGLDLLVFTAGIGENDAKFRARICAKLAWHGIKLDETLNFQAVGGKAATKISASDSTVAVYVIPTNEELMIAQNVVELFNLESN